MFNSYIDALKKHILEDKESRFVALQLLELHKEVKKRKKTIILELGVDRGQSTKVFINAIQNKQESSLISVDIRDCSDIANYTNWYFVKSDSSNVNEVISSQPILKEGIDILYIDSLHTRDHVYKELYGYFEYLNKNACIFFDDVDSSPYMRNQRKDNVGTELANRAIYELIESVFNSNLHQLNLSIIKGSTGLARLDKLSDKGAKLIKPKYLKKRKSKLLWKIIKTIRGEKVYSHKIESADSFLIDVTKFKD